MLLLADNSTWDRLLAEVRAAGLLVEAVAGPVSDERLPAGVERWTESARDQRTNLEGVIASGTDPEIWRLIPLFLRSGHPVWLAIEADQGSSAIYHLIPTDEEHPGQLRPVWARTTAPAVVELRKQLLAGECGNGLQFQWETTVPGLPVFPIEEAERAWLQDAAVLRTLASGEYQRVTAIHSGIGPTGLTTASVSLAGEGVPDAMWIYRRGTSARSELTVTTDKGSAVVTWEGDEPPRLQINCRAVACPGPVARLALIATEGARSTWTDAVRTFDLLDAARRSIRRRRTVELQFESTSERSQFKTQMTTVGCGLLLGTMCGLLALLLIGSLCDPRDTQQRQAETVGFVLRDGDFEAASPQLNTTGHETVSQIVAGYDRHSASILIEDVASPIGLSDQRRESVIIALRAARLDQPEVRTLTRSLHGGWFQRLMLAAWVVLFLPLGIFLAIQGLITVTPRRAEK